MKRFCSKNLRRVVFGLAVIALISSTAYSKGFAAKIETDLDSDGKIERIDLNSERQPALRIFHGKKIMWQGVSAHWNAWKIQITDVDGDGIREIAIGVNKATKFFPKPHNCLFIYGFRDRKGFPKWLGSSLSKPFDDFRFADLDGRIGEELIALETNLDATKSVGLYRWNSFGFTLESEQGQWKSAKNLMFENGKISIEADDKRIFLSKDRGGQHYETRKLN